MLIPAFAVDRTELVLLELRRLMAAGEMPRLPVYVDSPMALAALDVYRHALHDGGPLAAPGVAAALDGLAEPGCTGSGTRQSPEAQQARPIRASSSRRRGWRPGAASSTTWPPAA